MIASLYALTIYDGHPSLVNKMHHSELRAWRLRNNYTQETAANLLYITVGHYRKMEYGLVSIMEAKAAWTRILDRYSPIPEEAPMKNIRYDY